MTGAKPIRLKHLFRIVSGATPSPEPVNWNGDVAWATPVDIGRHDGGFLMRTERSISRAGLASCTAEIAPAGSLLLSTRAPIGYIAQSGAEMSINQGCRALVPRAGTDPAFYRYVLSTMRPTLRSLGRGSTFVELSTDDLEAIRLPAPPIEEQQTVVRVLDEETAKIDALIDRCRALRRALDGLRASASLAVPRGPVVPLRRVIDQICDGPFGSNIKSEHYAPEGVRVIRLQNIGVGEFLDADQSFVANEHFDSLRRHDARPGDLLVAGLGDEHNRLGRSCLVPATIGPAMVKADCFRLRLDQSRALHGYVMHYLNSASAEPEIVWQGRGATRPRMNAEGIRSIRLPLPSVDQQRIYVDRMSRVDESIRILRSKIDEQGRLLAEFRSALITAAVAGQIDVRSAA